MELCQFLSRFAFGARLHTIFVMRPNSSMVMLVRPAMVYVPERNARRLNRGRLGRRRRSLRSRGHLSRRVRGLLDVVLHAIELVLTRLPGSCLRHLSVPEGPAVVAAWVVAAAAARRTKATCPPSSMRFAAIDWIRCVRAPRRAFEITRVLFDLVLHSDGAVDLDVLVPGRENLVAAR